MKKTIAIQLNHTREEELLADQMALNELGIKPIWYGLIPFSDEISGAEDFNLYDAVVPFGTVKLIRLWMRGLLPVSTKIFYDEAKFDQRNYQSILGELLLNHGAVFSTLADVKDRMVKQPMFIKPTRDLKAFAGTIVEQGKTPGEIIFSRPQDSSLTDAEPVMMSPLREILREYRNFVVNGKIVESSTYKIGSKINYEPVSADEMTALNRFHDEVKERYQPHDTYVVDFARMTTGEFTVIEYNCLNCAGMYAIDRRNLFKEILTMKKEHT